MVADHVAKYIVRTYGKRVVCCCFTFLTMSHPPVLWLKSQHMLMFQHMLMQAEASFRRIVTPPAYIVMRVAYAIVGNWDAQYTYGKSSLA